MCYDAWFVAIAETLEAPLGTLDVALTRGAAVEMPDRPYPATSPTCSGEKSGNTSAQRVCPSGPARTSVSTER